MLTIRRRPRQMWGVILVLGLLTQGCSSDSDNPMTPAGPTAVGGNVSKGPISGALVRIFTIGADGTPAALPMVPETTDVAGNWSGEIPTGTAGPFGLLAWGGTYIDESTGSPVSPDSTQVMNGLLKGNASQVTPFTHTTYIGMQYLVSGNASVTDAIAQATASSVTAFGFDFATTVPRNTATATDSEKRYAALLGGLSVLIDGNPALSAFATSHKMDLTLALARDMADGRLDGLDPSGGAIDVPTTGPGTLSAPLPALSENDLSAWLDAANTYAASEANLNTISFNTSLVWAAAGSPGSGNCEVTFSGTGLSRLPEACFDVSSSQRFKEQLIWNDDLDGVEILVIPVEPGSTQLRTIYVTGPKSTTPPVWNAFNGSGIPGASYTGGIVTFTNVVLAELSTGGTSLTLNGQLDEPNPSRPAP